MKVILKKRGRPRIDPSDKKVPNTLKLHIDTWKRLNSIGGGNKARAIEELVQDHFDQLKKQFGKK